MTLFDTWARARDVDTTWVDASLLAQHFSDIPCAPSTRARRIRHIAADHRIVDDPVRDEQPWSVTGRRDHLILQLRAAGLHSAEISQLRAGDVRLLPTPTVKGTLLRYTPDPATCPGCALSTWIALLAAGNSPWAWAVEDCLCGMDTTRHQCRVEVEPVLPPTTPLLVCTPRHMVLSVADPMSLRSVQRVLRPEAALPLHSQAPVHAPPPTTAGSVQALDDLPSLLDDLEVALERVNAQVTAALHV